MSSLLRARSGYVEILTINRPDVRNALDPSTIDQFVAAVEEAESDDAVRVIVLTAAGDRSFCSGMDLRSFASDGGGLPSDLAPYRRFLFGECTLPVIAAVNGAAVAGGFELVLGCDVVIAADHARFGLPEVKRGLFAAAAVTELPGRLPLTAALELALTGELIPAVRAQQLGIVNRVVTSGVLLDEALQIADRIAANGPLGVRATKRLMRSAAATGIDRRRAAAEREMADVYGSDDAREGSVAFLEHRAPRWTGR